MATMTVLTLQNFIDGEHVAPQSGETEPILNPATGEVIAHAPLSTAADVDRAVGAARRVRGWSQTTPGERARALLKLADAIEEHAEELAELESDNAGKPIGRRPRRRDPVHGRQPALLRRRGACLEGRAAGEYLAATRRSSAASRSA
jgi:betaine-aldehyde dehydrogenase